MLRTIPLPYRSMPTYMWYGLLFLLAAGTTSTKIAGAGWLLFVLFGAWANWRWPAVVDTSSAADRALEHAVWAWLLLSVTAFALRSVPYIYWGDEWGDRHVEFRVLLVAMVTLGLVRRIRLNPPQLALLGTVLAFASTVTFVLVSLKGRNLPSDAIIWANSVMFLLCVLLPLIPRIAHHPLHVLGLSFGVLFAWAAVLLSGSRGVYPMLLWPIVLAFSLLWFSPVSRHKLISGVLLIVTALVIMSALQPRLWQFPLERVQQGWLEASALIKEKNQPEIHAIDTSVGVRLYMWQRAPEAILKSPWIGLGREGSLTEIQSWGDETGSKLLKSMGGLHNDWLNSMMHYGIFGTLGMLLFLMGPLAAAFALRHQMRLPATALLGIGLTQLVTTLTNTMAPNYYGVMYSLMMGLVLVSALVLEQANNGASPHPGSLQ